MRVLNHAVGTLAALALLTPSVLVEGQTPDKSGVKPSVISLPSGPGAIEGLGESFEPQLNTGSSTYSVNIELPPGRAGLQPNLSLSYNSGLGNSILGIGWDLALPIIKRQTDKGFPSYTPDDTFLFQGEELVPLSDETFRCENETSFQRFRRLSLSRDGFEGWLMTERTGTRNFFGRFFEAGGTQSRVVKTDGPDAERLGRSTENLTYCWALDQTIDLHGNRIDYEYQLRKGKLYPIRITYSHLDGAFHEVELRYEVRPDSFEDYRPTFGVEIDQRLSAIFVSTNGEPVRSYQLQYDYELTDEQNDHATMSPSEREARSRQVDLGVSVLKRVTQWDRTGRNFLPPLIFHYSFMDSHLDRGVRPVVGPNGLPDLDLAEAGGRTQLIDVNADGLPDLYSTDEFTGAQWVCLNLGPSTDGALQFAERKPVSRSSTITLQDPETNLNDVDGDGVVDVVRILPGTHTNELQLRRNLNRLETNSQLLGFDATDRGSALISNVPAWVSFANPMVRQMDLDFDKVSDFLLMDPTGMGGLRFHAFHSNGSRGWSVLSPPESVIPTSYRFDSGQVAESDVRVELADMNGDRLLDFVVLERQGSGVSASLRVKYWPYCALGRWAGAASGRTVFPESGDGVVIDTASLRDVLLQDFTGDGLADLLFIQGASNQSRATLRVNVAGRRWATPTPYENLPVYQTHGVDAVTTFRTADMNGNGSTDLVWRNRGMGDNSWRWLDLMPSAGKPNLLIRIDNSIGKLTEIEYGNAHQDFIAAREKGAPWRTKIPFAVQVVRRIRTHCGFDLNGDTKEDVYVSEFKYRDGYYDGLEKEFRGFAFAQRVDYGDDFRWDSETQTVEPSEGWDRGRTPTRQVSAPSLVTRYRFHTGTADQIDNDEEGLAAGEGYIDEFTALGGREEECLKGKQLMEEKLDPWVLRQGDSTDFDANCASAAEAGLYANLSPDPFVFTRARQRWGVRRLYRPESAAGLWADQNQDGQPEFYESRPWIPSGRFSEVSANQAFGRSVSFAFVKTIETDVIEANPLFAAELDYPERAMKQTLKQFDYDDYGNLTEEFDHGILGEEYDDERVVRTTYALGGEALSRWIISQPDTINTTDEAGAFVNRTRHFYDGDAFVGLDSGIIGRRSLLHRVERLIDETRSIQEQRHRYDTHGNVVEMRDPNFGTEHGAEGGHTRSIAYDDRMALYPVTETIVVGNGSDDLVMRAGYDWGFGVATNSVEFNGNVTRYEFDSFSRVVAVVKPGDSSEFPTQLFEYQAADPRRAQLFTYARNGDLIRSSESGAANRVVTKNREHAGTPDVYTTASYTDGCGKSLAELGEDSQSGSWIVSQASSYNLMGTPAASWLPYEVQSSAIPRFRTLWPNGRPPETDARSLEVVSTDHFYDAIGREIQLTQAPETWGGDRKHTETHLLPFEKRLYDENDSSPESAYFGTPLVHFEDGLGRLVRVHEVVRLTDEGEVGILNAWETSYSYDLNDKLERITDSQDNVKVMDYDGLGRLTFMDDPDRGVMRYVYDAASNLIETTDAKEQVIRYTYDGVNRILTEDYLDEGLPFSANHRYENSLPVTVENRPDVAYFYDRSVVDLDVGDGTQGQGSNPMGQLSYVWDLTGEEHFSYDARGRMEWQVKRIPDTVFKHILVSWQTKYEYDSLDRVTRLTYPDGDRVAYGYNARNLLANVTGGPTGFIVQSIQYRPSAQQSKIVYGNGVVTTYDYDPRLRLRDLDTDSPVSGKLIDYAYTFDSANNITRIDDGRDLSGLPDVVLRHNTQVFQYDDLYRLTQVKYPTAPVGIGAGDSDTPGVDYRYDRIGNMLLKDSNIEYVENGFSVTRLGGMRYGGDQGRKGRRGRGDSSAGPHALSGVSAEGTREFSYDGNGNMTDIDGAMCNWDFKDRLVAVEGDGTSAKYRYDYTDRRVLKEVAENANHKVTQYVSKFFELRPSEPGVKYVWSGDTRIARITSDLDSAVRKIQRKRLWKGWNLLALDMPPDPNFVSSLGGNSDVGVFSWNEHQFQWEASSVGAIDPGSPFWLNSRSDRFVSLGGNIFSSVVFDMSLGRTIWTSEGSDRRIDRALLPAGSSAWIWNPEEARWHFGFVGSSKLIGDSILTGGESGSVVFAVGNGGVPIGGGVIEAYDVIRYYHQDHLGSTDVVSSETGVRISEFRYYPYGSLRYRDFGAQIQSNYDYSQKERDRETDLSYFDARYYASGLGRFLSTDSMESPASVEFDPMPKGRNPYLYCFGNPLTYSDPSGRVVLAESGNSSIEVGGKGSASGSFAMGLGTGDLNVVSNQTTAKVDFDKGTSSICNKTSFLEALGDWGSYSLGSVEYCRDDKGKVTSNISFSSKKLRISPVKSKQCLNAGAVKVCADAKVELTNKGISVTNTEQGVKTCTQISIKGTGNISAKFRSGTAFLKGGMAISGQVQLKACSIDRSK